MYDEKRCYVVTQVHTMLCLLKTSDTVYQQKARRHRAKDQISVVYLVDIVFVKSSKIQLTIYSVF